eukprot:5395082-Prymnesium_polylepis.1
MHSTCRAAGGTQSAQIRASEISASATGHNSRTLRCGSEPTRRLSGIYFDERLPARRAPRRRPTMGGGHGAGPCGSGLD